MHIPKNAPLAPTTSISVSILSPSRVSHGYLDIIMGLSWLSNITWHVVFLFIAEGVAAGEHFGWALKQWLMLPDMTGGT